MSLEHLRLFRDIAQTGSLTRAAEMNDVTQSAASQQVRQLERQFGVKLMDRGRRPLALTEAGRLYLDYCRDLLRRRQDLDAAMDAVKGGVEGTVRVAAIYSVGLSEMVELEEKFAARHPEADLKVEYLRPEKVYEAVIEDRADLGLVSYPEPSKEVQVIQWRKERMVVAMAPSHPLAARQVIEAADLEGHAFVGFDDDLPVSRDVARFLREKGVTVNRVLHFDNIQTMKEAVSLGPGVSILPEPILRADVAQKRLCAIPLAAPGLYRPLGILHGRKKRFNRATRSFLDLLMEDVAGQKPATALPTSRTLAPGTTGRSG